jgi:hypothetical protein
MGVFGEVSSLRRAQIQLPALSASLFHRKREKSEPANTFLTIRLVDQDWVVAAFKCRQEDLRKILVDFYGFVQDSESVRSLHFLIRDRLGDKVVFSFRMSAR